MTPPAIRASDLELVHGSTVAIEHATFSIPHGSTTALIGANGSGKSSLLHAVAGLLDPVVPGTLEVGASLDAGGVALVLQSTHIDPSLPLSVHETVEMARYPNTGLLGRPSSQDRAAVDDALARLELTGLARRQIHELSGGQRQRVLVAQGLAQGAELLLLDEPFTGLDTPSRRGILDALDAESASGRTVVYSTHDLADARRCDLVLLLATEVVAVGTPEEVLRREHLESAFGGRMLRLDDEVLVVDDPHHEH